MSWPGRHLALVLNARPGHCAKDRAGVVWRWDGRDWCRLGLGDCVLSADATRWYRWDGLTLRPVRIQTGAIVRITWVRDGVEWQDQLCAVADIDECARDVTESRLLVEAWPAGPGYALVPWWAVELVSP